VLRPTVAIAWFVVFGALALHQHQAAAAGIAEGSPDHLTDVVQEVRRFYPMFPLIGGRARSPFQWCGHRFEPGAWFILDLYGTNHDPRIWGDPGIFRPERFREWDGSAYNFIPQGGGEYGNFHRCPGEWMPLRLMSIGLDALVNRLE
jgi:fatty-acid peroxygenase